MKNGDRVSREIRVARFAGATALVAGVALGLSLFGARAEADSGAWFGTSQVASGKSDYAQNCATCHGAALSGGGAPALVGSQFTKQWNGKTAKTFFDYVHQNMPLGRAGSLAPQQYADIVAYTLSRNGIAPGDTTFSATGPMGRVIAFPGVKTAAAKLAPIKLDVLIGALAQPTSSGPTQAELDGADDATTNWLMYNKGYRAERYSKLAAIDASNAHRLHRMCAFPLGEHGTFGSGPVEYDGLLYVTTHLDTYAIDARTCRKVWSDRHAVQGPEMNATNRGIALADGRVIRGTQDGYLYALDAKTGKRLWMRQVVDWRIGEGIGAAPIAWHGLVFVGKAGGDWGIQGRMMAFHAADGSPAWSFDLVPTGTEKGARSWQPRSAALHGGGASWTSYALDEKTGTLFIPVGNPGPDFDRAVRGGKNLFTDSVVALDATTGRLRWASQMLANDYHDYDTTNVALFDAGGTGYVAAAGKAGVLHVFRRDDGKPVYTLAMTTLLNQDKPLVKAGTRICPVAGVQWNGAAHSAKTGMLYVNAIDWCSTFRAGATPDWVATVPYTGLANGFGTNDPTSKWSGWINAVNAKSGKMAWRDHWATPMYAAVTPTAGDVLFTGDLHGTFLALDARTGKTLYRSPKGATGGPISGGVITYMDGGKQYVAVNTGNSGGSIPLGGTPTVVVFGE